MIENIHKRIALIPRDGEFALLLAPTSTADQTQPHSGFESVVVRLFDQFQGRVLRYVVSSGLPFQDAEDIVQETFLSLFRHLELGRPSTNLNGWIFRVAHNLALKRRIAIQAVESKAVDQKILAQHPCGRTNAEEQFLFNQTQRLVRQVFEALPERDQRCLYLRAEGLKYRQIADVLGISLGAVAMSLSRSLARMTRATGNE